MLSGHCIGQFIYNHVTFEWLRNVYLKYTETSGLVAVLQYTANLILFNTLICNF